MPRDISASMRVGISGVNDVSRGLAKIGEDGKAAAETIATGMESAADRGRKAIESIGTAAAAAGSGGSGRGPLAEAMARDVEAAKATLDMLEKDSEAFLLRRDNFARRLARVEADGNGETERAIALRAQLAEIDKAYFEQMARGTAATEDFVQVSRELANDLAGTAPKLGASGEAAREYEKQLRALERALDAAGEPQRTYAERIATISNLWREGVIDGEHARSLHEAATRALEDESRAMGESTVRAGQLRLGYRSLSSQVSGMVDAIMRGEDPIRAITSRLNNTGAAVTRLQGAKGGLASFLMGPWGVAIGAGTALLAGLALKLGKTEDEVKKLTDRMKEQARQAELNAQANAVWESSLDGLIDKSRKLRDETDASLQTERVRVQAQVDAAAAALARSRGELDRVSSDLERAEQRLAQARTAVRSAEGMSDEDPARASAVIAARQRLSAASAEVTRLKGELQQATAASQNFADSVENLNVRLARVKAGDLADPVKARFARMREEAERTIKDVDRLAARLAEIDRMERQAREQSRGNGEFGRRVSAAEAAAIARAAGLQVNSGDRSYAQQKALYDAWVAQGRPKDNPVAPPGSSAHEGARGRWALDIQAGPGVDPASIRKTFDAQGVRLTKILRERGHWHVEGMRDQSEVRAERMQTEAEATEAATNAALALARAYLTSAEAAARARAERASVAEATRKGMDADAAATRQLALEVANAAAEGARGVAQLEEETAARAEVRKQVEAGTLAARDMDQALQQEAALRPLVRLQAVAQGEALAVLTQVIDRYRKSLKDANDEEARGQALRAITALRADNDNARAMLGFAGSDAERRIEQARRAAERDAEKFQPEDRSAYVDQRVERERLAIAQEREDLVRRTREGLQDNLTLLEAELGMAGLSRSEREKKLRLLDLELRLNRDLGAEYSEQIALILEMAEAEDDLRRKVEQAVAAQEEFRRIGEGIIDELFDPKNWEDWGAAGKRILKELLREMLILAAINPLKNALFGTNHPTLGAGLQPMGGGGKDWIGQVIGGLGAIFGGSGMWPKGSIGMNPTAGAIGMASGTEYFSGGHAWVGEFGKELVRLPRGSKIHSAATSRRLAAANDSAPLVPINIAIDATGADAAGLARVETQLRQLEESIPVRVVAAWQDARSRFVVRG
ncbi:MAG TPA: hypothetical protein VM265_07885 [Sphingomicrobium sp.]|nr:hypothetical protein [Sphingomicrobium sp.]